MTETAPPPWGSLLLVDIEKRLDYHALTRTDRLPGVSVIGEMAVVLPEGKIGAPEILAGLQARSRKGIRFQIVGSGQSINFGLKVGIIIVGVQGVPDLAGLPLQVYFCYLVGSVAARSLGPAGRPDTAAGRDLKRFRKSLRSDPGNLSGDIFYQD